MSRVKPRSVERNERLAFPPSLCTFFAKRTSAKRTRNRMAPKTVFVDYLLVAYFQIYFPIFSLISFPSISVFFFYLVFYLYFHSRQFQLFSSFGLFPLSKKWQQQFQGLADHAPRQAAISLANSRQLFVWLRANLRPLIQSHSVVSVCFLFGSA